MFCEQNRMRTDPQSYIPYVEEKIALFGVGNCNDDEYLVETGWYSYCMSTTEGKAAWEEGLEYLKNATPERELKWSMGVWYATEDHCQNNFKNRNNQNFSH